MICFTLVQVMMGFRAGAGDDVVLLSGDRSEYSVISVNIAYRIVGPDGNNYIYNVEVLRFSDSDLRFSELGL